MEVLYFVLLCLLSDERIVSFSSFFYPLQGLHKKVWKSLGLKNRKCSGQKTNLSYPTERKKENKKKNKRRQVKKVDAKPFETSTPYARQAEYSRKSDVKPRVTYLKG